MTHLNHTPRFTRLFGLVALATILGTAVLAGCTSDDPVKGKGFKGTNATEQRLGETAKAAKPQAQDKGTASVDGANCTPSSEWMAWCNNDNEIFFCSGGHFFLLDCKTVGGKVCTYVSSTEIVDCGADPG